MHQLLCFWNKFSLLRSIEHSNPLHSSNFNDIHKQQSASHLYYSIMKSNKAVLTILVNVAQLLLQSRIAPSQTHQKHLASLHTQLQLLRSQLLPSTEIIHFLVQHHSYNLKNKISSFLKTAPLQKLILIISFTITSKVTSLTHVAEIWKLAVIQTNERDVARESKAHELLFLVGKVFQQLNSTEFLSELVRNREGSKNYIIDFQIGMKQQDLQKPNLDKFSKATYTYASLDNSRELQISCYSSSKMQGRVSLPIKKIPIFNPSNIHKQSINSLESTRGGSLDQAELIVRRKLISQQNLFEIYDSELDLTILSSDSDPCSPRQSSALNKKDQFQQQFQLLLEEKDKDQLFVEENFGMFNSWQLSLFQNFS